MPGFRGWFRQKKSRVPRRSGVWVGADFCSQHEDPAHTPDRLPTDINEHRAFCAFCKAS